MAVKLEMTVTAGKPKRQCGDCQLCCKLLPMHLPTIEKEAGQRCPHQRANIGCNIYPRRPMCCQMWNCRWLVDEDAHDLRRPDRVHYVIDIMPDIMRRRLDDGTMQEMIVVQVWCDPKYPDAHRDPALRRYLDRVAEKTGSPAIVRFSADPRGALALFAPSISSDHQWHEMWVTPAPADFKGLAARLGAKHE